MREGFKTSRGVTQWQIAATILRESVTEKELSQYQADGGRKPGSYAVFVVLLLAFTIWVSRNPHFVDFLNAMG